MGRALSRGAAGRQDMDSESEEHRRERLRHEQSEEQELQSQARPPHAFLTRIEGNVVYRSIYAMRAGRPGLASDDDAGSS